MRSLICLFFVASLFTISFVCGQATLVDIPVPIFPIGFSGNGTIWYQSDDPYYSLFKFGNVYNPIEVSIIYQIGSVNYDANVCLNSLEGIFPIDGVNLASSCPAGGFGIVSNTSSENLPPKSAQVFSSSKSRFISSRLAMAAPAPASNTYSTQTEAAKIYVRPTTNELGGFIVTIPDSEDIQQFFISFSGQQCSDTNYFPIGPQGACQTIDPMPESGSVSLDSGAYKYYSLKVPQQVNSIDITVSDIKKGVALYVQNGYYPTTDWFLNTDNDEDDDQDVLHARILTPKVGDIYYIALYNSDDSSQTTSISYNTSTCSTSTQFGLNCQHDSNNTAPTPLNSFLPLSATVNANTTGYPANNGNALSYDYSDDEDTYVGDYAYFQITDFPNLPLPYYVRVSVGSNDPKNFAPPLFGQQGSFPSAASNSLNMSSTDNVANQILIPVLTEIPTDPWFVSVKLPADFSIWVGVNCAGSCDNGDHGVCYCGNQTCASLTNNYQNITLLYTRSNFLEDSGGECTCDDDDYASSFDCSQKNNGNNALYIALIAVGGAIVLAVAIGVPLYCCVSNKKATYDRV